MTEKEAKRLRERLASYRQCYAYEEFMPIPIWTDDEAVARLVHQGRDHGEATDVLSKWRELAADHDYHGPVLWRILPWFVLVPGNATQGCCWRAGPKHRPLLGPLYKRMTQQYRSIGRHERTSAGFAFWIPRALEGSVNARDATQRAALGKARKRYALPEEHLQSYGALPLVAALMLTNYLFARTVVEGGYWWARTDTERDGSRIGLYWVTISYGYKSLHAEWLANKRSHDTFCYPLAFEPHRHW